MSQSDEFVRRVKQTLDAGVEEIDEATQTRLRAARRSALESRRAWRVPAMWGAAVAAAVTFAVVIWVAPQWRDEAPNGTALVAAMGSSDAEAMVVFDGLDLYEDLEFYQWLAEHGDHAG